MKFRFTLPELDESIPVLIFDNSAERRHKTSYETYPPKSIENAKQWVDENAK